MIRFAEHCTRVRHIPDKIPAYTPQFWTWHWLYSNNNTFHFYSADWLFQT